MIGEAVPLAPAAALVSRSSISSISWSWPGPELAIPSSWVRDRVAAGGELGGSNWPGRDGVELMASGGAGFRRLWEVGLELQHV